MGTRWEDTWRDIARGGDRRWKTGEEKSARLHFALLEKHGAFNPAIITDHAKLDRKNIFAPLCGDSAFVPLAFRNGHRVAGVDIVQSALELMRERVDAQEEEIGISETSTADKCFTWHTDHDLTAETGLPFVETRQSRSPGGSHTGKSEKEQDGGLKTAAHRDMFGQVRLYTGDVFVPLDAELGSHDILYDKDSFSALPPRVWRAYVRHVTFYLKPDAYILLEGNERPDNSGPPYNLSREVVDEYWPHCDVLERAGPLAERPRPLVNVTYILRRRHGAEPPRIDDSLTSMHAVFSHACYPLGVPKPVCEKWAARIVSNYTSDPKRAYHTLRHVADMLQLLETLPDVADVPSVLNREEPDSQFTVSELPGSNAVAITDRPAVALAVWFHNAVYDSTAMPGCNQRACATLFEEMHHDVSADESVAPEARERWHELVPRVQGYIYDTATHVPGNRLDGDLFLFLDLDAAVLFGQFSNHYIADAAAIRFEHQHVEESRYRDERIRSLDQVAGSGVFLTKLFRERYGRTALRNMSREKTDLQAGQNASHLL